MRLITFLLSILFLTLWDISFSQSPSCKNVFIYYNLPEDAHLLKYYENIVSSLEQLLSNSDSCIYLERSHFPIIGEIKDNEAYIRGFESTKDTVKDLTSFPVNAENFMLIFLDLQFPYVTIEIRLVNINSTEACVKFSTMTAKELDIKNTKKLTSFLKKMIQSCTKDKPTPSRTCKFIKENPVVDFGAISGVALITWGSLKFFKAKSIHDEYEMYKKESEYLEKSSEFKGEKFDSRAAAYKKAQGMRISSRDIINTGGGVILVTGLYYFVPKIFNKKDKNNVTIVPDSQNGYTSLKLTYKF